MGSECVFCCADSDESFTLALRENGFALIAPNDRAREFDYLIVDHYGLDYRYEEAMRGVCGKIMAIDDLANRRHSADLLLDQNALTDDDRYDRLLPKECVRLLGFKYALIDPLYAAMRKQAPIKSVKRALIYFGAADRDNFTAMSVEAFLELDREDIALDVVLSEVHNESVRRFHGGNITVHSRLESLAPLMSKADLAIGAGGVTMLERLAISLPSIVIAIADNQIEAAKRLAAMSHIVYLGFKADKAALKKALSKAIDQPMQPPVEKACDALGARRVAAILLLNVGSDVCLREAKSGDEELFLELANDALTRQNSFNSGFISADLHRAWFAQKLSDRANTRLFVASCGFLPIGQTRFEKIGDHWQISFSLAPYARGFGLGGQMLRSAMALMGDRQFTAIVKENNIPSRKTFEAINFTSKAGENGTIIYHN
jgi:UDP-2,4-diacetamido-2,4,6-trideoxy-beta-L-altropyranose hydrolase